MSSALKISAVHRPTLRRAVDRLRGALAELELGADRASKGGLLIPIGRARRQIQASIRALLVQIEGRR